MSINSLTGSESLRFDEISQRWLVFEPVSNEDFSQHELYTVPIGQETEPELNLDSGSVFTESGSITIEKDIYRFDDETEANEFVSELGSENIVSIKEKTKSSIFFEDNKFIEVQVVNLPKIFFKADFIDYDIKKGFMIEVFDSASIDDGGVKKVLEQPKFNKRGEIISDTFLKFFAIRGDEDA